MQATDLHLHSRCSDGALAVDALLDLSAVSGVNTVAVADHDTLTHLTMVQVLPRLPVHVVPAVEVTTEWMEKELHILVYFPSLGGEFAQRLQQAYTERCERFHWMVAALVAADWQIDTTKLYQWRDSDWVLAQACIDHPDNNRRLHAESISTRQEFYAAHFATGKPIYSPRPLYPLMELLATARDEAAVTVWAHPSKTMHLDGQLEPAVGQLVEWGLSGLEVFYSAHTAAETTQLRALCEAHRLLESAGSDFHDPAVGVVGAWESYGLIPQLAWMQR